MKRIISYGAYLEYNLGIPSLLHGLEALCKEIYKAEKCEMIFYENNSIGGPIPDEFESKVTYLPFKNNMELLIDALRYKLHLSLLSDKRRFFESIQEADYVISIYGICFCSSLEKHSYTPVSAVKSAIYDFTISFIAKKLFKTKTIKTAASYGPFETRNLNLKARYALNNIFNSVFAREIESKWELQKAVNLNKEVIVTPDLGHMMKYMSVAYGSKKLIGISVSHQIIKQWKADNDYIQCICRLIEYISKELPEHKVILIPNETSPLTKYNDIHVANEILENVPNNGNVELITDAEISGIKLKSIISSCEILVASRYHSCVAALSAGIPTLVIGWHYKYGELMALYGQEKWIVSNLDCSSQRLIEVFDSLWRSRHVEHNILLNKYEVVVQELINAYEEVFK